MNIMGETSHKRLYIATIGGNMGDTFIMWFVLKTTLCDTPYVCASFKTQEEAIKYVDKYDSKPDGRPSMLIVEANVPHNIWGRICWRYE